MSVIFDASPQGSEEWLAARRGCITGSRFKDVRDKTAKGAMSAKAMLYAQDVARERCGGRPGPTFVNGAMKFGVEQEPIARAEYEAETGNVVYEAGFAYTEDGKFGCSVDGLVGDDGVIEIKTMVGSDTLFKAVVEGENDAYIDQINGALWLLGRKWCDLILWAPDLPAGRLTVRRITRDESAIEALEADLVVFDRVVTELAEKLQRRISGDPFIQPAAPTAAKPPQPTPKQPAPALAVPAAEF